jgi:hypothetical protein
MISGCVRLRLRINVDRLRDEVASLPASFWGSTANRARVHEPVEAVFLRGYAPAEGPEPLCDRPALAHLPYARVIISQLLGAPPLRCLLARLRPGGKVEPHVDQGTYFDKSLRVHVPVESNGNVWMVCAGQRYVMQPGEVWTLNNRARHAVWNAHPTLPRTHLICDFVPTPHLLGLIAAGEPFLGQPAPDVEARLTGRAPSGADV